MKQQIFLTFLILLIYTQVNAQKIKFKKDFVLVDNVEVLKYDKQQGGFETNIYSLDGKLLLQILDKDNFDRYYFNLNEKVIIESTEFDFYTHRQIVQLFFDKKIFNSEGIINEEKLKEFKAMYDEKITERTIIIEK
jgi:hypothetical protein